MTGSPEQLELLGDAPRVAPAPPDALGGPAEGLPADVRLGTSSWSFPGWAGLVYDREHPRGVLARDGLRAYARHPLLRTVCVDRAYYGNLPVATWQAWAEQVPADFRFLAKAPLASFGGRLDSARTIDPRPARDAVASMIAGLGEQLAAVIFQFSPGDRADPGRFAGALHDFLRALPDGPVPACELRTPRLLTPDYAAALADAGAVHCFTVHPAMPGPAEQAGRLGEPPPGPLVARWNLGGGQAYEAARERYWPFDRLVDPDPASRAALARMARSAVDAGREAFIAINNKAEGSAPRSVAALARAIVEPGAVSPRAG